MRSAYGIEGWGGGGVEGWRGGGGGVEGRGWRWGRGTLWWGFGLVEEELLLPQQIGVRWRCGHGRHIAAPRLQRNRPPKRITSEAHPMHHIGSTSHASHR